MELSRLYPGNLHSLLRQVPPKHPSVPENRLRVTADILLRSGFFLFFGKFVFFCFVEFRVVVQFFESAPVINFPVLLPQLSLMLQYVPALTLFCSSIHPYPSNSIIYPLTLLRSLLTAYGFALTVIPASFTFLTACLAAVCRSVEF